MTTWQQRLCLASLLAFPGLPTVAATGDLLGSFPAPSSGPFGLAWDGTSLWNGDDNTGLIFELDTLGNVLSSFAAPCTFTKGLTFDGTNLWTACDSTGLIYEVTRTGTIVSTIPTPGSTARGLTWDGTNFWIADASTNLIYEVTTGGAVVSSFAIPGSNPRGLTWDGTSLWHADAASDLVYELSTAGAVLSSFATPGPDARGLTLDGTDFWIADQNTDTIYRLEGPVASADLSVSITDSSDPAPLNGPLIYTVLVTNSGPSTATGITLTDNLPGSVNFVSANPSQGSCIGGAVVSCTLGTILSGGTASVEIQVVTTATGNITNNASVSANEADPVPANNTDSEDTSVVASSTVDVPLTQVLRLAGFLDYTVTGGTLRTDPNTVDACSVAASDTASVAGIPATATVNAAYLYWAGSGAATDGTVTLDGVPRTADRTFEADFVLGGTTYDFFGGFEDVTAQVAAKGNGAYTFAGLSVDNGGIYCAAQAVISGWALYVIYEDAALTGKTLVLYDGFDLNRNSSSNYLLSGIFASGPPEAKTSILLWEGDDTLGGASERLLFNGVAQSDALNPVDNLYNGTINSLGSAIEYGADLDTFDVSGLVSVGDTLATVQVDTGPDLVLLNSVLLQVKTNVIAGTVFEDVNYGGGAGRNLATASAAAPAFSVPRPGATVELYDATGTWLRGTVTDASGAYGFSGLPDGDYQVRVVNDTVASSRPGGGSGELAVQTFRTDASGAVAAVTSEVGGADPAAQDDPANVTSASLGTLTAQSVSPVTISAAVTKAGVDFGFNVDTVVNSNDSGQGSLAQFITNANTLGNANLAQDGLTAGTEHSLFMIPSNADPLGRSPDPNFDAGRGVARIALTNALPPITDADTAIDGTTQTQRVGDTNAGLLGAGGTVGLGPDGVAGTADEPALAQVAAPEIEIVDANNLTNGLEIRVSDTTVRGLAVYGFGDPGINYIDGDIVAPQGFSVGGLLIEQNVLGTRADAFADPGGGNRTAGSGVVLRDVTTTLSRVRDNLIGFVDEVGVVVHNSDTGQISGNEVRDIGQNGDAYRDAIQVEDGSTGFTVSGNLIDGANGNGVSMWQTGGSHVVVDNTIRNVGTGATQTAGVAVFGTDSVVERNDVSGAFGPGVTVVGENGGGGYNWPTATGNRISRNRFGGNGGLAIDLTERDNSTVPHELGDGHTLVPGTDATTGNIGIDAPVIAAAAPSSVSGTTCAGCEVEVYRAVAGAGDTQAGTDYGEGIDYLGSDVADGTGAWSVTGITSLANGETVSAITIDAAGNTSEFGANTLVQGLEIVKRAYLADGTPIPSGATMPDGVAFFFVLYVNNRQGAVADVSLQDVLDPIFGYQPGTIRVDTSLAACAADACTPAEEAAIFASVSATSALTDAEDGDVARYEAGTTTIDVGDQNASNAQLDVPANRVVAVLFSVRLQ